MHHWKMAASCSTYMMDMPKYSDLPPVPSSSASRLE